MKLVIAIVHRDDSDGLADALREQNYPTTLIGTTGGFLREGNATFMVGVEEKQIDVLMALIQENCKVRTQLVNPMPPVVVPGELYLSQPIEVQVGGATVFVLNVDRFEKF